MTPPTPGTADNKAPTLVVPNRVPPEERFWKHYSPHHEFPLSSVTSAALHILAVVLLLLSAWVAWKLGFADLNKPPDVTAVALEEGGGGGNPKGLGPGPGQPPPPEESSQPTDPTKLPPDDPQLKDLKADLDPIQFLKSSEDPNSRVVKRTDGGEALRALEKVDQSIRKEWFKGLGDKGQGGPGHGGGEGSGLGTGSGNGTGPGNGGLTERQKRLLRWSMLFNTRSGDDYARQLQTIKPGGGAILAYPVDDGREYRVIRDLGKRPAVGKTEDIRNIKSIFWIDDQRDSVAGLARALQLPVPTHFVAFFPPELEAELARIEHDYKNLEEDQIEETKFEVIQTQDGYHARVVFQSPKR